MTEQLTDAHILAKMFRSRHGAALKRLWRGNRTGAADRQAADVALCRHLMFWCRGDVARVATLFAQSGLYRHGTWTSDYRAQVLNAALMHPYQPTQRDRDLLEDRRS